MTYWHCALSVSLRSCSWFATASKFQGAVVLSLRLTYSWIKFCAGCLPLLPQVFSLFIDFPPNICIFYISEQGEWQSATRVRQLPDFTALAVQKETGELKLGQKVDSITLDLPYETNVSTVSLGMKSMKRPPSTPTAAKTTQTTVQSLVSVFSWSGTIPLK